MKTATQNLLILSVLASLFTACGSRSSDFTNSVDRENPLPPCPDSPNCVRITRDYPDSIDVIWETTLSVLKQMRPYDLDLTADEYRIDAIFLVVFFQDDMAIKMEEKEPDGTYLHVRSSSRLGYHDFGVNSRRVKEFLEKMSTGLNE